MRLPEAELIKRIITGEKHLFGQIIDDYQKSIYNLAYRMAGNREDAMDLTQETFLRAFKGLGTYNPDRPFSPWIHRIAANLCVDHGKKQRFDTVSLQLETEEGAEIERSVPDVRNEPGSRVVILESERELVEALTLLPEKFRVPLILFHLHNYSYEEIGDILEVPPGTVKTWIYRGRNQLKDYFKKNLNYREGDSHE